MRNALAVRDLTPPARVEKRRRGIVALERPEVNSSPAPQRTRWSWWDVLDQGDALPIGRALFRRLTRQVH